VRDIHRAAGRLGIRDGHKREGLKIVASQKLEGDRIGPHHAGGIFIAELLVLLAADRLEKAHRASKIGDGQVHESHEQLRTHLSNFLASYNYARRLKTLSGLTPHEYMGTTTSRPDRRQVRLHRNTASLGLSITE
jgi:hypothetical protein